MVALTQAAQYQAGEYSNSAATRTAAVKRAELAHRLRAAPGTAGTTEPARRLRAARVRVAGQTVAPALLPARLAEGESVLVLRERAGVLEATLIRHAS